MKVGFSLDYLRPFTNYNFTSNFVCNELIEAVKFS